MSPAPYVFAGLRFHPSDGRLERLDHGLRTQLRPQVSRLLQAFLDQPQTLLERDQLRRAVWDEAAVVDFESGLAAALRELRAELKNLHAAGDLIETVPRRGYRLNCAVQRTLAQTRWSPAGRKRLLGLGAALLLLILATVLAWLQTPEAPLPDPPERSLAVLPFVQLGQAASDPRRLDLLLADQLLVQLWELQLEDVILIGRASVAPYEGRPDLAQAVAGDLGVDLLIEGSVVFDGGRVSISARLLEMPSGRILWAQQIEGDEAELRSVREVVEELVGALKGSGFRFPVSGG
ncbi:MAG: winged helix-turn-helix domain-containing protein [Wenzhouxiangella sp.]